ncbi:hypothetical protein EMCRGX_G030713 [Ephydatia muelleri]
MHVMDFAKKQLEKYGWAEGEGLGKNGDGRAQPIRVKIKRDYGGVGLQPGEEAVGQWWNKMFDSAVRNITVTADKEDVVVQHNPGSGEEDLLSAVNRSNPLSQTSHPRDLARAQQWCLTWTCGRHALVEQHTRQLDMG